MASVTLQLRNFNLMGLPTVLRCHTPKPPNTPNPPKLPKHCVHPAPWYAMRRQALLSQRHGLILSTPRSWCTQGNYTGGRGGNALTEGLICTASGKVEKTLSRGGVGIEVPKTDSGITMVRRGQDTGCWAFPPTGSPWPRNALFLHLWVFQAMENTIWP